MTSLLQRQGLEFLREWEGVREETGTLLWKGVLGWEAHRPGFSQVNVHTYKIRTETEKLGKFPKQFSGPGAQILSQGGLRVR